MGRSCEQKEIIPSRQFPVARFVVTRECPFNCLYCHNEGMGKQDKNPYALSVDDYLFLAQVLKGEHGLKKVNLTGGDPFIFKDLPELASGLRQIDLEVRALSKGMPVKRRLDNGTIKGDEFTSICFSFDTLDPGVFKKITRVNRDTLEEGIAALDRLVSMGIQVEINCVIPPEAVDDPSYITEMIKFGAEHGVSLIKFIEVMDIDRSGGPYLEEVLGKAGIEAPQLSAEEIVRKYTLFHDGQRIEPTRCMCSVTQYTGKLACLDQELYIDPQGRVNPCLEWEVQENPYITDLFLAIRSRDRESLTRELNDIKIGKFPCPIFMAPEERRVNRTGLSLGSYH